MFFDEAKIYVKAGDGGNGVVAFRRETHVRAAAPAVATAAGAAMSTWLPTYRLIP